jgi:hypothetical protein
MQIIARHHKVQHSLDNGDQTHKGGWWCHGGQYDRSEKLLDRLGGIGPNGPRVVNAHKGPRHDQTSALFASGGLKIRGPFGARQRPLRHPRQNRPLHQQAQQALRAPNDKLG